MHQTPPISRRAAPGVSPFARSAVLVLAGAMLVVAGCGPGSSLPVALTVSPQSGPPGTLLRLSGIDLEHDDLETVEAWLGNEPTLLLLSDDGTLHSGIPLYLGEADWPEPPATPQVLELRRGGQVIGRSTVELDVEPLQPAPGSTAEVVASLVEAVGSFAEIVDLLPAHPETGRAVHDAALAMLRGVVDDGKSSLQALLDGTIPLLAGTAASLELSDALLASSGALEFYEAYADQIRSAGAEAALGVSAIASVCEEGGEDVDLACLMQIHTMLRDFAEVVIAPTASAYAHKAGIYFGFLALAGKAVPGSAIVGALLSVADFVMNKLVPGLLPSELTRFDLDIPDRELQVGDETQSTITVAATNAPPPISIADLAEGMLTAIGLGGYPKGIDEFRKVQLDVAQYAYGLFYMALRDAEAANPGTFPDLTDAHFRVPTENWGPFDVDDPRLVTLFSFDMPVVEPLPEEAGLEWRAVDLGEATVQARTRGPGARSTILRDGALCWGCTYHGGAFGLDSATSEADLVVGTVTLRAVPASGPAPFTTTLVWEGLEPQSTPYTCTLDPGDGTPAITIEDCATVTQHDHTYTHTSRLQDAHGAFVASLRVEGTELVAEADVPVGWTFAATPAAGTPPLAVTFSWSGFDPAGPSLTCRLDPGDGSPVQTVDDCGQTLTTSHTYAAAGSYTATLFVEGGAFEDYDSSVITVGSTDLADAYTGWFRGEQRNEAGYVRWEGVATFTRVEGSTLAYRTTETTDVRVEKFLEYEDCTYTYDTIIAVPPHDGVKPIARLRVRAGTRTFSGQISHWIVHDIPQTNTCSDGSRVTNTSFQQFYLYMYTETGGKLPFAPDGSLTGTSFKDHVHYTFSFVEGLEPPPIEP